ncbi:DsbA family protein [Yoonia sp. SS1-5]|uniref:DsbA family protein n=1 Tax=Yoonia rhodophyticola TaxID=3137370 RepID=A0AAN0NKT8_9RHOB
MSDPKFTIIYDTYCGWCYGAAPVFDALVATGADVEVLHRHLFQGPLAYRMSEGKGALVLKADARIHALTGQEFSDVYKKNVVLSDTEILASHYTAQAAALVHAQGPAKEFALRQRLEKARYIDGVSAADRDAVVAALRAEDVPADQADQLGSADLAARAAVTTRKAESLMAQVGSQGVPTVLKTVGDTISQIDHSAFYGRPEDVASLVR